MQVICSFRIGAKFSDDDDSREKSSDEFYNQLFMFKFDLDKNRHEREDIIEQRCHMHVKRES